MSSSSRRARSAHRYFLGLVVSGLMIFAGLSARADTTANWLSTASDNWTATTRWSTAPNYPNNGTPSGTNYLANIAATGSPYTVMLNSTITLDGLTLNSGVALLDHTGGTLTSPINIDGGTYRLDGGTIANSTVTLAGGTFNCEAFSGSTLNGVTVNGGDLADFEKLYVQNGLNFGNNSLYIASASGVVYFNGSQTIDNINLRFNYPAYTPGGAAVIGTLTLGNNAVVHGWASIGDYSSPSTLVNNGTINADLSPIINTEYSSFINNSYVTNNGTIEATNGGILNIDSPNFTNHGTLAVHSGGIINAPTQGLNVGNGTLTGSGTISGNVILSSDPSTLAFNIGGLSQGSTYDSLSIQGNATLAGDLSLTLTNGFHPSSGDTFTVLTVAGGDTMTGSFLNVANGGRLETTDGYGNFLVSYGTGAFANEIVLSNFQVGVLPEPSCLALLAVGSLGLLARRIRRTVA